MSSSNKPVEFTHVIHPANAEYFKLVARSAKDIRTARSGIQFSCTKCMSTGPELRQCGRCKSVWYCSRECQTKDWPYHKQSCKQVDGFGVRKLIEKLVSNAVLRLYLQTCFVLDLDLLRHPHLDKPFMARVDIGIEPADILDFVNIFLGQGPSKKTIPGMLQVNGFTAGTQAQMVDLTPKRREIWREARERANSSGCRGDSVGLVEFTNGGNKNINSITMPVHIESAAMRLVKEAEPFPMVSAITGEVMIRPFSTEACMEFINTHIRADKKNQLLLRTEMRPSDIQIIHDAAANSSSVSALILNEKLAREHIYKSLLAFAKKDVLAEN
ncbi:hypothetical protein DFH07DRAFT_825496 [Mycena maculata]|uniref:MYND-type domain-containing protein n=1 Tax=Mycena maculata TaxID=230809 RepID=A0AAD7NB90_9AGAR|nr:hypothetical protein DFH07DRAFT_825496 [Mycena maculata]